MKHANIQVVRFRRKREGKTDYKKRIKLVGSKRIRFVVRKTLTKIITQLVAFDLKGDIVKLGVDSTELKKYGWKGTVKNIPASYMVGYLMGKKAVKQDLNEAILDSGLNTVRSGVKIYAVLKGAIDAGMKINASEEIFPSSERINGAHINGFQNNLEEIKKKIDESEK